MTHTMRVALDGGVIASLKRDREFTLFLDLKKDYHRSFITQIRDHIQEEGILWRDIRDCEELRAKCAESFIIKYGPIYWGSEEARQKYLLEVALKEPSSLCVYPKLKRELIRMIDLLLLFKAKNILKDRGSMPIPMASSGQPAARHSTGGSTGEVTSNSSSETPNTVEPATRTAVSLPVRRTRRLSEVISGDNEARAHPETPTPASTSSNSTAGRQSSNPNSNGRPNVLRTNAIRPRGVSSYRWEQLVEKYKDLTVFAVTASTQTGMAPVWVKYQDYLSVGSFIAHMAQEASCTVPAYWNPSMQLYSTEEDDTLGEISPNEVVAVSLKMGWSGLELRVRPGREDDFRVALLELQKAWAHRFESERETPTGVGQHDLIMIYVTLNMLD